MKIRKRRKLTKAEAKKLVAYVNENGGQILASLELCVAPATLSRNIHRHTAPSPMLVSKLVEKGILAEEGI